MDDNDKQVAAQNAEAANAENPTKGAVDTAAINSAATGQLATGGNEGEALSGIQAGLSAADESKMIIGSGIDQAAVQKARVISQLASTPATETEDDEYLKSILETYIQAAETRFKHLLNGMENSTAAMLKALGDGLIHLSDHIEQQNAIANKEETNV